MSHTSTKAHTGFDKESAHSKCLASTKKPIKFKVTRHLCCKNNRNPLPLKAHRAYAQVCSKIEAICVRQWVGGYPI